MSSSCPVMKWGVGLCSIWKLVLSVSDVLKYSGMPGRQRSLDMDSDNRGCLSLCNAVSCRHRYHGEVGGNTRIQSVTYVGMLDGW